MKYCIFKEHWSRFPSTKMGGKKNLNASTKAVLLEFNIVFFLANATIRVLGGVLSLLRLISNKRLTCLCLWFILDSCWQNQQPLNPWLTESCLVVTKIILIFFFRLLYYERNLISFFLNGILYDISSSNYKHTLGILELGRVGYTTSGQNFLCGVALFVCVHAGF